MRLMVGSKWSVHFGDLPGAVSLHCSNLVQSEISPSDLSDLLQDFGDHDYFWGKDPPSSELGQSVTLLTIPIKGLCSDPCQPDLELSPSVPCSLGTKSRSLWPWWEQ